MPEHKGFTHFKPEKVLIPKTERGGKAPEGTEVVLGDDGVIAFAGKKEDANAYTSARRLEGATVAEEKGGVLLPGMTDTHFHPAIFGAMELLKSMSIDTVTSFESLRTLVAKTLKEHAGSRTNEPLIVFNYDSSLLGPMTKINFDDIESKQPVFFIDRSFHGAAGNTAAMKLLDTYIKQHFAERLEDGAPFPGDIKGQVFSESYVMLALELAESFQDIEKVKEKTGTQIESYLKKGVTAMHDLEVMSWHEFMAYMMYHQEWKKEKPGKEFPVRQIFLDERVVSKLSNEADTLAKQGLFTEDFKQLLGVKFFADGAIGCETALMGDAYEGHEHGHEAYGRIVTRIKEGEKAMKQALKLGINRIAVHAIGDEGIRRALDFAKRWKQIAEKKKADPKFRIEHFELPLGGTVKKAVEVGAWVSMQSNFGVEDAVYHDRLGGRSRLLCPHADLVSEGVPMMLGSDGMPSSMLYVVWSAMHHPDPNQRLDAISAMTAAAASAGSYEGALRGTLQSGSKTDIVIATPQIMQALANHQPVDKYINEAMMPAGERPQPTVRNQVSELEDRVLKVFVQGEMVYEAGKDKKE